MRPLSLFKSKSAKYAWRCALAPIRGLLNGVSTFAKQFAPQQFRRHPTDLLREEDRMFNPRLHLDCFPYPIQGGFDWIQRVGPQTRVTDVGLCPKIRRPLRNTLRMRNQIVQFTPHCIRLSHYSRWLLNILSLHQHRHFKCSSSLTLRTRCRIFDTPVMCGHLHTTRTRPPCPHKHPELTDPPPVGRCGSRRHKTQPYLTLPLCFTGLQFSLSAARREHEIRNPARKSKVLAFINEVRYTDYPSTFLIIHVYL